MTDLTTQAREMIERLETLANLRWERSDDVCFSAADLIRQIIAEREEAAELIESWGSYASQYFQDKHNLAGDIAKFRPLPKEA